MQNDLTHNSIQYIPIRPQTLAEKTKLSEKKNVLTLLVKFYLSRIHWLCLSSRQYFGLVRGNCVALVIEASDCVFGLGNGSVMKQCKFALRSLVEGQLLYKDLVYCISYGSTPNLKKPQGYSFTKFKSE